MNDEQKKEMLDAAAADGVELSDEVLDAIAGGYIYHDAGDASAHRKEAYYVIDNKGEIVMRLEDLGRAQHWADNLRTNQRFITTEEFEKLRKLSSRF